jgi:hypothetical protein
MISCIELSWLLISAGAGIAVLAFIGRDSTRNRKRRYRPSSLALLLAVNGAVQGGSLKPRLDDD